MAFNKTLAERVRQALAPRTNVEEKRMFGGLAFMVDGHMTVGVEKQRLMVRLSEEEALSHMRTVHVSPMDFTGRPMRGFLYVDLAGLRTVAAVKKWTERAVAHAATLPPRVGRAAKLRKAKAKRTKAAKKVASTKVAAKKTVPKKKSPKAKAKRAAR